MPRGALFLDRDGVLNEKPPEGSYLTDPRDLRLLPGVGQALATLRTRMPGLRIAIVTNQRAVARGLLSAATLERIHARLRQELATEGGLIDRIDVCPHDAGTCDCRKPEVGLFRRALRAWPDVSAQASAVVGDSAIDIIAGRRIGARTYLVGHDRRRALEADAARRAGVDPDEQADSLAQLVSDDRLPAWLLDGSVT